MIFLIRDLSVYHAMQVKQSMMATRATMIQQPISRTQTTSKTRTTSKTQTTSKIQIISKILQPTSNNMLQLPRHRTRACLLHLKALQGRLMQAKRTFHHLLLPLQRL